MEPPAKRQKLYSSAQRYTPSLPYNRPFTSRLYTSIVLDRDEWEDEEGSSEEVQDVEDHPSEYASHQLNASLDDTRARLEHRLKTKFEAIFEKYGRDFSGIGDEVDLRTGKVVVNNGHLVDLKDEKDVGDTTTSRAAIDELAMDEDEDELAAPPLAKTLAPGRLHPSIECNDILSNPPRKSKAVGTPNAAFLHTPPGSATSQSGPADGVPALPSEADIMAQFGERLGTEIVKIVAGKQTRDTAVEPAWRTPAIEMPPPPPRPLIRSALVDAVFSDDRSPSPENSSSLWAPEGSVSRASLRPSMGAFNLLRGRGLSRLSRRSSVRPPPSIKSEKGCSVAPESAPRQQIPVVDITPARSAVASTPDISQRACRNRTQIAALQESTPSVVALGRRERNEYNDEDDRLLLAHIRRVRKQNSAPLWGYGHWERLVAANPRHTVKSYRQRYRNIFFKTGKHYLTDPDTMGADETSIAIATSSRTHHAPSNLGRAESPTQLAQQTTKRAERAAMTSSSSLMKPSRVGVKSAPSGRRKRRYSIPTPETVADTNVTSILTSRAGRRISQRRPEGTVPWAEALEALSMSPEEKENPPANDDMIQATSNYEPPIQPTPKLRRPKNGVLTTPKTYSRRKKASTTVSRQHPGLAGSMTPDPALERTVPNSQSSGAMLSSSPVVNAERTTPEQPAEIFERNVVNPSYVFSDEEDSPPRKVPSTSKNNSNPRIKKVVEQYQHDPTIPVIEAPQPLPQSRKLAETSAATEILPFAEAILDSPLDTVEKAPTENIKHVRRFRTRKSMPAMHTYKITPDTRPSSAQKSTVQQSSMSFTNRPAEADIALTKSEMWLNLSPADDLDELSMGPDELSLLASLAGPQAFKRALSIRPKSEVKPRRLVSIASTPKNAKRFSLREGDDSPAPTIIETPGGHFRRCGEMGFRCERDFCFGCSN